jgi:hypothetical protein
MGLADIIASGIAIANDLTEKGEIQANVTFDPIIAQTGDGDPVYYTDTYGGDPESIPAIVEHGVDDILTQHKEVIPVQAKITFLRPITSTAVAKPWVPFATGFSRKEPLDPRDRIILPDGLTGPIVKVRGMTSGATDAPFMFEVWIGRRGTVF